MFFDLSGALKNVSSAIQDSMDEVALNPQPLPPDPPDLQMYSADILENVALNPQPLPPKIFDVFAPFPPNPGDPVMLNPQPLPPNPPDPDMFARSIFDQVLLNPQPLPPGPDDLNLKLLADLISSRLKF